MLGRDFEGEVWLRFVFELDMIWPNRLLWKDELNPRVRCAFGNVLISMPSYAAKLSHYHYELHIIQYCAMQTFTFWQKSDISVLNQTFSIQFWSALQPWFACKEIRNREICWYFLTFPVVDCWLLISTCTPPDGEITPTLSMLSLS